MYVRICVYIYTVYFIQRRGKGEGDATTVLAAKHPTVATANIAFKKAMYTTNLPTIAVNTVIVAQRQIYFLKLYYLSDELD